MNKQLETLYNEFKKYPYITSDDLEIMFKELWKEKKNRKDIRRMITALRDSLTYIIDNDGEY